MSHPTEYLDQPVDYADPGVVSAVDELSLWSARFGALLLDNLELVRGASILDLGCGTGFPLFELANRHGPSCRAVGADLWLPALARAEEKRRVYGLSNAWLTGADGAHLPFATATFDLIVSNVGLNNFADPAAALAECARVAQPGARIVLTTNPRGHMRELYEVFGELLDEIGQPGERERLAANEDHRPSREAISALLKAAGFEVTRVLEDSFRLRCLDGAALLRHFLIRLGFLDGWRVTEPGDQREGRERERTIFAALEERLDALARSSGELALTVPMLYVEARRSAAGS